MKLALPTPDTDFSRDLLGRYICNTFDEVLITIDPNARATAGLSPRGDLRPFDFIVVGGGTFGSALAPGRRVPVCHRPAVDAAGLRKRSHALPRPQMATDEIVRDTTARSRHPGVTDTRGVRLGSGKVREQPWRLLKHLTYGLPVFNSSQAESEI